MSYFNLETRSDSVHTRVWNRTGNGHVQVNSNHRNQGGLQVDRKLMIVAVCFLAAMSAAASAAFGQDQKEIAPRLPIRRAIKPAQSADAEKIKNEVAATGSSKTASLPLFLYRVESDRDNNNYTGVMVGADPFTSGGDKNTHVNTFIVPIIVITNTKGVSFNPKTGVTTIAAWRRPTTIRSSSFNTHRCSIITTSPLAATIWVTLSTSMLSNAPNSGT
jgi:hypothetical protein